MKLAASSKSLMALRAPSTIRWPDGKDFAFTVFDDTERGTVENNRAIYGLLRDLGMRTTKSIWPVAGPGEVEIPGPTCEDEDYLDMCVQFQSEGFEIALHNATYHTSDRALTLRGLERFRELFRHDPHTLANHSSNREGIYWGAARLSGWRRLLYELFQSGEKFRGHVEGDPLFWGDLCKERVRYIRNFTFTDLNTTAVVPQMPYHDAARPWVNQWFAGSDARDGFVFNRNVTKSTVDKLVAERGGCLLYTHFGKDFYENGKLNPQFVKTIEYIASRNGWFVPVATLLDFLASEQPRPHLLTCGERSALENKWLVNQMAGLRHRFSD